MTSDDLIAAMNSLSLVEKRKFIEYVIQKYSIKACEGSYIVSHDWWLNDKDDDYDRPDQKTK